MNFRALALKIYCLLFLALGSAILSAADKPLADSYDSDSDAISITEDIETSATNISSSTSNSPIKTPQEVWCFKIKEEYKSLATTQNAIETCISNLQQLRQEHSDTFCFLINLVNDREKTAFTLDESETRKILEHYKFLQTTNPAQPSAVSDKKQSLTIKDITRLTVYICKTAISLSGNIIRFQILSKTRKICKYTEDFAKMVQIQYANRLFNELYPDNTENSSFIFKDQAGFQTTLKTNKAKIEKIYNTLNGLTTQEMICFEQFTVSYPNIKFDNEAKQGQYINPVILQQLIDKGLIFENSEQRAKKTLRAFIKTNPDVHQLLQKNNIMPLINNLISDEKLIIEKSDIKTLIITPLAQCIHDAAALITGGFTPLEQLYQTERIKEIPAKQTSSTQ